MRYCLSAKVGSIDAPATMNGCAMKSRIGNTISIAIIAKRTSSPMKCSFGGGFEGGGVSVNCVSIMREENSANSISLMYTMCNVLHCRLGNFWDGARRDGAQ